MDALDQLYQYAKQDPNMGNLSIRDNGGEDELMWGELYFQGTGDGLIMVFYDKGPIGIYGINETLTILKGHQELFKR